MVDINQRPHGRVRIDQSDALKGAASSLLQVRRPGSIRLGFVVVENTAPVGSVGAARILGSRYVLWISNWTDDGGFGSQVRRNAR